MSLFHPSTFLLTPSPTDVLVFIFDVDNVLVLELDPLDVVNSFVSLVNVKVKTKTDMHTLPFSTNAEALQALTLLQIALDTVRANIQLNQGTTATAGPLGLPTDGAYGGILGAIAGVAAGDSIEDAFDKVETTLGLLVPAKPQNLSAVIMTLTPNYTAREESTGTIRTTVTNSTSPTVEAADFYDGKAGTLTAEIDNILVGTRVLVVGSDVGSYGSLNITDDSDPYVGQAGKEGFWKQLTADITPTTPVTVAPHTFEMIHSVSGTSVLIVYVDNPTVPSISGATGTSTAVASYTSGVPHLNTGGIIVLAGSANNAVSKFYNQNKIVSISGSTIASQDYLPVVPPLEGASVPFSLNAPVLASTYAETAQFTATVYNSKNDPVSLVVNTSIRVDSTSNEIRVESGVGQYPTSGTYGGVFSSVAPITPTEELQMINNLYQFPPQVDYSTRYPVGPDYSTITGGTYSLMRWVTFDMGRLTSEVGFAITINNAISFNGSIFGVDALQSNFAFYAIVVSEMGGDIPTVGWIDCNAGYPGVGTPTNDGDPALVIGSSHGTMKTVTFGTALTGRLYVRMGIPQGNGKKFSGVTLL